MRDSFAYVATTAIFVPPDYSTFQPPAKGGSYIDPVFGTPIKRISNAMTTTDAGNGGHVTTISPEYSSMSPFNQDNTRVLIQHFSYFAIYDGDGNFLKDLYQYGVDASAEPRWSRSDPNVFYFVKGNQLKSFNAGSNAVSVVHTFSEYSTISGKGESDISFDGTKFVFCGDNRDVFVYDFVNNVKGSVLNVSGNPLDSLYITPDNHVTITWLATGSNRYNGIEMFDQNMNFLRQLTHAGGHMDVTRDTNGDEVLVWANFGDAQLTTPCTAGVTKIRLADAKQTCIWKGDWGEAVHVSATDNSGWAFVEVYTPKTLTAASDWTPYQNELLQVKLDGTEVRRLAHHRSRPFPGNTYVYMPKISASRDGTKVVFGSNYGLQSILGYPANYSDAYLIDVSQASPSTGGTTSAGSTGSGEPPSDPGTTTTGGTTTGSATPPITGTITPPPPAPPTAPTTPATTGTRIEDNDPAVAYAGAWSNNTSVAQSGSHARLSMDANSTATLNFNGTGVTVLGFRDEWAGIARIYVDGTLKGDVDTYATTSVAKVPMYSVSGLSSGTHTIQVMATGTHGVSAAGSWVWVDAFDIEPNSTTSTSTTPTNTGTTSTEPSGSTGTAGGTTTATSTGTTSGTTTSSGGSTSAGGTTTTSSTGSTSTGSTAPTAPAPTTPAPTGTVRRIEEDKPAVHYTGTWSINTGSTYSGSSAKLSNKSGARATFTFVGTSVTWIGFNHKASGIGRVYIDNVLKSEIDTYSASSVAQSKLYTASDLPLGTHTIAIEATGRHSQGSSGSWVWVDAFDYVGDPLSSSLAVTPPTTSNIVAIPGGTSVVSADSPSLRIGSAVVDAGAIGMAPSGLAIFGRRENGVLVSEAGVPGVATVLEGRIYAELAGPVSTGLAISNPNNTAANLTFHFTDSNGSDSSSKTVQLAPHGQISRFLNQAPFDGPQSINGTFTFNSDVPVAAVALRGHTNERGEFLMTTLPVVDANQWDPASMFFPHFADGAGWSTKFVLVNPTEETISGTLRFVSQGNGSGPDSLTLNVDGQNRSSVTYNIPARSSRAFSTSGAAAQMVVGSARITPDISNAVPVGVAIFSLKTNGVTVAEAGIPSSSIGNAFRMYAEASAEGSIRTGVAITNPETTEANVTFQLVRLDGTPTNLRGSVTIPASGQRAVFINDIAGLQSLPMPFKGILRIKSDSDIAVSGLRTVGSSRVDLQACKLEYSIVSPK